MSSAERPLRLLRLIVIFAIIDFLLLVPLVAGVIFDYHELAPILGPIHGWAFSGASTSWPAAPAKAGGDGGTRP